MAQIPESNTSSPSTNWRWIKTKIEVAPARDNTAPRRGSTGRKSHARRFLKRQQIVVEFRGGPEASYLVRCEGKSWRYPGHWCLHDVMTHLATVVL